MCVNMYITDFENELAALAMHVPIILSFLENILAALVMHVHIILLPVLKITMTTELLPTLAV